MFISLINLIILLSVLFIGLLLSLSKKRTNKAVFFQRLPLISANIFLLSLISFCSISFFEHFFQLQWPSIWLFMSQFMLIMFLDDFEFYFWHRFLHANKYMLKKIHRLHHQARSPFPLDFIYAHPLEWLGGTLGITIAFIILIQLNSSINAYVLWSYTLYRTMRELDIHSNTESKLLKYLPFLCRSEHHALHHVSAKGNYASTFTYLDKLFKTDIAR